MTVCRAASTAVNALSLGARSNMRKKTLSIRLAVLRSLCHNVEVLRNGNAFIITLGVVGYVLLEQRMRVHGA